MLVLITYDVNTEDAAGRRRLRQIAKQCVNYGQRVQNSVFECLLDTAQCRSLQNKLCKLMDAELFSGRPNDFVVRRGSVQIFPIQFAPQIEKYFLCLYVEKRFKRRRFV